MTLPSFLALGDSYTIGEGIPEEGRWPAQLVSRLRAGGRWVLPPRIVAKTGWTTEELSTAINAEHIAGSFDLVTLLAGVNDQYRGYGVDRFRRSFAGLVQTAGALAKLPSRLIVLSIPDWGVTPYADGRDRPAISREIDNFNSAAREVAMGAGARFLDITPASRLASNDPALLAGDGLHPSAMMYQLWVDELFPMAMDALNAAITNHRDYPENR